MSVHLQRQIGRLKRQILTLGTLVEEALGNAIESLQMHDLELAQKVIDGDQVIDEMEIDVEEDCLHTLALHQPVAQDLRFVVAVLKINNDLERIADLAVNIAEQARFLGKQSGLVFSQFEIFRSAGLVRSMLKQSLDALVNLSPQEAQAVRQRDDEVDDAHRRTIAQVKAAMRQSPDRIDALLNLLSISRQLERIGDHAVNVAEDVIYMVRGDILRHKGNETAADSSSSARSESDSSDWS
jgi:phosphate transport system protein